MEFPGTVEKVRVYELASALGLQSKDILPDLVTLGYKVKSPSSRVERVKGEGLLTYETQALLITLRDWKF
jgi:hypothetical protein